MSNEIAHVLVKVEHPMIDDPMTLRQGIALDGDGAPIMGWDGATEEVTDRMDRILNGVEHEVSEGE